MPMTMFAAFAGPEFVVTPLPRSKCYEEVANMLRQSRACWRCYEDVARMLETFKPSRDVNMVWLVANISATRRACPAHGIWRTTRQTEKWAALPHQTAGRNCYEEVANILVRMLRGCYENVTSTLANCWASWVCRQHVTGKFR